MLYKKILILGFVLLFSIGVVANNDTSNSSVEENQSIVDNSSSDIVQEPLNESVNNSSDVQETLNETINSSVEENTSSNETILNNETEQTTEKPSLLRTFLDMFLEKLSFIKGEIVKIRASLSYENNSPLVGKSVDFYADEEMIGSQNTDNSGQAEFEWDTSLVVPGVYLVISNYSGDGVLESSYDYSEITIEEAVATFEEQVIAEETVIEQPVEVLNETVPEPVIEEPVVETKIKLAEKEEIKIISDKVQEIDECEETPYEEEEKVYGNCVNEIVRKVCDDEPLNTSCHDEVEEFNYTCLKEIRNVQKIRKECRTKGVVVNNTVKLNTPDYRCSTQEEGAKVIVICDSRYDGNGDGKCSSGESCMKFVIDGDKFTKYEKNSRDDFIEDDESFFLEEIVVEVLK